MLITNLVLQLWVMLYRILDLLDWFAREGDRSRFKLYGGAAFGLVTLWNKVSHKEISA